MLCNLFIPCKTCNEHNMFFLTYSDSFAVNDYFTSHLGNLLKHLVNILYK